MFLKSSSKVLSSQKLSTAAKCLLLGTIAGALTLTSLSAFAATVTKVSGSSVLIDTEGGDIESGRKYFLKVDGKNKAIVQIKQVKGGKAIGKILKGKATTGASVEAAGKGGRTARRSRGGGGGGGGSYVEPGFFLGGMLGYSMSSQSVKGTSETVSMSGSSINFKAFGDYSLSNELGLIVRGGVDQLAVTGKSVSLGAVETKIMYLSADALMRYQFLSGSFRPYLAGGMGLYFPLTKKSDVLDETRIASSTVFLIGAGANYFMSQNMLITGVLEYNLYPPSNDVKTSAISFRAGAALRF